MPKFSDLVTQFVQETQERMDAVFAVSIQKTVALMQEPLGAGGNMPIDTGFLRNSIVATPGATPPAISLRKNPGTGVFEYDSGAVNLVIAGAKVLEGMTVLYSADYAVYVEFGARGRPGRRFVGLAVQQFPQVVSRASRELEHRIKNG